MAKFRNGATGFLEDYTYDLTENDGLELASHKLEVSPSFAKFIGTELVVINDKTDWLRLRNSRKYLISCPERGDCYD